MAEIMPVLSMHVQFMFRANWEFAQSADCIAQTEDPQNACQSADWQTICRLRNTNCANC